MQVLQLMLSHGDGLWLGPDSDGLLNYCDAGRPGLSLEGAPAVGPSGACAGEGGNGLLNYCDASRPGLSLQQAQEEGGRGGPSSGV